MSTYYPKLLIVFIGFILENICERVISLDYVYSKLPWTLTVFILLKYIILKDFRTDINQLKFLNVIFSDGLLENMHGIYVEYLKNCIIYQINSYTLAKSKTSSEKKQSINIKHYL